MKAIIKSMKVSEDRFVAVLFDVLDDKDNVIGSSSIESQYDDVVSKIQDVVNDFEKDHSIFDLFEEGDIIENGEVVKSKK